jgi:hypothetical protein
MTSSPSAKRKQTASTRVIDETEDWSLADLADLNHALSLLSNREAQVLVNQAF